MRDIKYGFSIEQEDGCTWFQNNTDYILEISTVAVKPKRKTEIILIIPHGKYAIFDTGYLDLTKISCKLVNKEVEHE